MKSLDLGPIRRAAGTVKLPGSKSISNRVLLLAALARGDTLVRGLLDADDTRVMRDALARLGVEVSDASGGVRVRGVDGRFPAKTAELALGNAGTAFRPLTAVLALAGGEYRLSGVPRTLEQGREVFAVPGSPLDPRAEGTNDLIKQGATLVTQADDVATVLRPILGDILGQPIEVAAEEPEPLAPLGAEPAGSERERIAGLLGPTPASIDDLVRISGCTPAVVRVILLELELAGRLERHGGGLVSLAWDPNRRSYNH